MPCSYQTGGCRKCYGKIKVQPHPGMPVMVGGGFFGSIFKPFKKAFSNPLRGLAAIGTLGGSEVVLHSADLAEKITGKKASDLVKIIGTPLAIATGGESALPTAAVAAGLKIAGKGRKKRKSKVKNKTKAKAKSKAKAKPKAKKRGKRK